MASSSSNVEDAKTTFTVDSVKLGPQLKEAGAGALKQAWQRHGKMEAGSDQAQRTVHVFSTHNMLAKTVHEAFFGHYPLVLSPDVIWLTIVQGLANHVEQNSEKLRAKFVQFSGKKELVVSCPDFVKGSPDNDWPRVFPEFCGQIQSHIGKDTSELLACDFSTTGAVERIAAQIALMDTVQHYFTYTVRCGCGIPSITLKGTKEDWQSVRDKAAKLKKFELDWWLKDLLPVLDQFVAAASGKVDKTFWRSVVNFMGGSGFPGDPMTGWIQTLYPYLNNSTPNYGMGFGDDQKDNTNGKKEMQRNSSLSEYMKAYKAGVSVANHKREFNNGVGWAVKLRSIPPSISRAPFNYVDMSVMPPKTYPMSFMSGIVAIVQHKNTLALEPVVGWAVVDNTA